MEIVQQLLSQHGDKLLQSLTGQAGFSAEQARSFLPPALEKIVGLLKGGGLDLGSLLGGGAGELVGKLDPEALAAQAGPGVDAAKARQGLETLAPQVLDLVKQGGGGLGGLLGQDAGGLLGSAGKLAGKLFK